MTLSDVQIVTGISILVSGYYSATHHGMSGYHWKMMVRIAWFSSVTHLGALSCLRTYLHENKVKLGSRLALMGSLAVMLIYATFTTSDGRFADDLPAICFLDISKSPTRHANGDVLVSVLLLIYNIVLRVVKLSQRLSVRWLTKAQVKWSSQVKRRVARLLEHLATPKRSRNFEATAYIIFIQPALASLVLLKTYYFLYSSAVAEVRFSPVLF